MKYQTSVVSDEVEYYDQSYRKRQKDREEGVLLNDQNLKKLKYHFEPEVELFQRNEICDTLIDIQA